MDANLVILDNFKKVKATVKGSRDNYRWLCVIYASVIQTSNGQNGLCSQLETCAVTLIVISRIKPNSQVKKKKKLSGAALIAALKLSFKRQKIFGTPPDS